MRKYQRTYCGPWALSHLLDISTKRAEQLISWASVGHGRRRIRGTTDKEMLAALDRHGSLVEEIEPRPRTIKEARRLKGRILVLVSGHWLSVINGTVYSNGGRATMSGRSGWQTTRVRGAWGIN